MKVKCVKTVLRIVSDEHKEWLQEASHQLEFDLGDGEYQTMWLIIKGEVRFVAGKTYTLNEVAD